MVNLEKLMNQKVSHNMYGIGNVTGISQPYLVVTFQNDLQKKFTYPNCFELYLKLEHKELVEEIQKDIEELRMGKNAGQKTDFNACVDKMHAIDKRVKDKQEAWIQAQREKLERQRMYRKQRLGAGR